MPPKNILSWLVLLTLATVTSSEHYHIVPVDSTDLCHETCFTLEQLVQTYLLSGGDNLTLSFLPGDHVLTEQLLIRNFRHVHITSQNKSTAVVRLYNNIHFVSITKLSIENFGFVGANVGPQNFESWIIDGANDVYINDCYFMDFKLLNQAKKYIVKITNTQAVKIESTLFTNNTGRALHVDADGDVYITNSEFTRNDEGAVDIQSNNTLINNTEFNYNSAESGGAVEVVSGTVMITWCNFTNNEASRYGGAISIGSIYSGSSVFISNSELKNNSASEGGAIYFFGSGSVSISNSELAHNSANSGGAISVSFASMSMSNSELTNNSVGVYGGAIDVYSSSVSISNSELTYSNAGLGGAIRAVFSNVSISNSELTYNRASTGVIYVASGKMSIFNSTVANNSIHHGVIYVSQSLLILKEINVTNNIAIYIVDAGGIIHAFSSQVNVNGPTTLSNNRGVLGGAISAHQSQIYINAEGVIITNNTATSGGGIFLRESTLFINEPIKIYHNTAHKDGGGIYAYSSTVEFNTPNKQSEIVDNIAENGGGIYAVATTFNLTRSYVNIESNTARANGGGVYLQQSSKLYVFKLDEIPQDTLFVKLMINNNLAQYGGGIFVADDTESGTCRGGATETDETQTIFADCFIQTIYLYGLGYSYSNIFNTFMTKNMATQFGADIYGGLLDRCTANQNADYEIYSNGLDYINKTIKSSTELSISSRPVQVIVCKNDYSIIFTRKGHTFKIIVMAVDQVGNSMNATIQSSVVSESGFDRLKEGQAKQLVGNQCTELEYNVFSRDSSAQMELYAEGPCINLGISRTFINISFQLCTCPIGLKPIQSPIECKCDCDPDLHKYQIKNCSEENGTIMLESNNKIWIEVINTTNKTGYVVSNCVFDYCVEKPVNVNLSNPDEQCAYNRSGVLCGECKPGLSLVLATSRCAQCSNLYLLLLLPFALAGILLVVLILVLNITIATGSIHGLIFYANIVAANKAIFFPSLNNFLIIFISWLNLDLGINTCFYDGMTSQGKVLLQLVFPAYLFLLMFLIIILSKYIDSFAKLLSNRNPVAALGTLIVLSYSKLLRFIIAALQYKVLDYPDDTSDIIWVYDGNVQYFTCDHIPRFVAAIIIFIASGLFTLLLFFGQWFPRCSKVMKWTKNTKYIGFMDAYHAPFTPKHRYWVGVLLFALIVHNLVASMAPDTFLPVLSSGAVSVGLISWKLLNNRLYKSKFCDSFESLFLLNIVCLAFGTLYVKDTNKDQSALANTSMAISFTLFVTTLSYHFYQFVLKKSNTWLKIEDTVRNLRASAADIRLRRANNAREMYQLVADENDDDELLEAVDDYEERDPVNPPYTDDAEEEADPDRYITPPIIRPATKPDQLREPALDVLAPLTTEDYRPAPPPPRVNHRSIVTRTEIGPIRNEV